MTSQKMKKNFGSLSFYRQALMIGVPVMLQSLIQSLVSLVDNFMVAGLGDVKMYGALNLTDFVKIIVAHLWLKKEKWVKNLTVQAT